MLILLAFARTSFSLSNLVQPILGHRRRDVVERRVFTVTGKMPAEEDVEQLIETGESETIFQKAILEQGRGQARAPRLDVVLHLAARWNGHEL